jgi:endonuclease YncB( thermonuclease family)
MRRFFSNLFWGALLVLVAFLLVWQPEREVAGEKARPSGKVTRAFTELAGCRLVEHRDNDGDSFHLLHEGREHEFRLYFVDCPEKRRHHLNADRIAEQGNYFGGLSAGQTVAVGLAARDLTLELLRTRPFTVHTRWQPVFDSGRYYAFVSAEREGGVREDLSETLVKAGLCRIHTEGASLPDGRSERDFEAHLRKLEREAKARRAGAWK